MTRPLDQVARTLARCLAETDRRVVFAESCTGGLASAALASVPGISQWHCGSAVTYREQTKMDWLGVSPATIEQWNVVSCQVAGEMACGVLRKTVEADIAGAVTGYLGPDSPPGMDGVVWIAVAWRVADQGCDQQAWQHRLTNRDRSTRQQEAAILLLDHVRERVCPR